MCDEKTAKLLQAAYYGAKKEAEKRGTVLQSFRWCDAFGIRDAAVEFYGISPPIWWSIDDNKMTRPMSMATIATKQKAEHGMMKESERAIVDKNRIRATQALAEFQASTDEDYLIAFDAGQLDMITFTCWKTGSFCFVAGSSSIFRLVVDGGNDHGYTGHYHVEIATKTVTMVPPPLPVQRRASSSSWSSSWLDYEEAKKIAILLGFGTALFGWFYVVFSRGYK